MNHDAVAQVRNGSGTKRASMREVAERAGVAMSSVSRVLSDHPDVSPAMRDRVLAAVDALGYEPDLLAQSLRRRETLTIGFAIGDIGNPLFADIVAGAETMLRESGYSLILTNSEGDPALEAAHIRLLAQRRVDGVIVSVADETNPATIQALDRLDIPCVVVDRNIDARHVASVFSDHRMGMRAAVDRLLDLGHREIVMIGGDAIRPSIERHAALEQAFAARGLPPTYRYLTGGFDEAWGRRGTERALAEGNPTALIAGGNQIMLGALRALHERRVALGRDLSFVGCDETAITELYDPPISVVRRDTRAIGRAAAALILEAFRGDERPADVVLPTEFIERASCAPPRDRA